MPSPFRFDRVWHFDVTPAELWSTLSHTERYREWWKPTELSELARQLREYADELEKPERAGRKRAEE